MDNPFLIENCMRKNPVTIRPEAKLSEAIQLIMDHRITGLTVTDEEGYVKGIISELDCLKGMLSNVYNDGQNSPDTVADHMCTEVLSCSPDEDIVKVGQSMLAERHRRRPVVKNGKLVGQLSCRNILWAMMSFTEKKQG